MAFIYFYIVKQEDEAPSNLPEVLVHILNRKDTQTESDDDAYFNCKTFVLKCIFVLLPATYPLGKNCSSHYWEQNFEPASRIGC